MGFIGKVLHFFHATGKEPDFLDDDEIMSIDQPSMKNSQLDRDTDEIDLADIINIGSERKTPASKGETKAVAPAGGESEPSVLFDQMLLRTLMDNLSDYVYFKDRDSRFIMVNKAYAEKVFSLSDAQKAVGRTDFDFFSREYAASSFEAEKRIMSTGEQEIGKEVKQVSPYGHVTWFLTSTFPLKDDQGTIIGTWGISRDISAQKKAEEELQASEEMLRQTQKMEAFGQLAGGIAHDFNNMLSVILSSAQLVELSLGDAQSDLKHNIAMVIDTSKKAADLTQQLLSFGRKEKFKVVELDFHDVVHSVVNLLQHTIDKRIRIVDRLNAPQSLIRGDYMLLQNALLNLGLNSRDAMPEGGTLTFATDMVGPGIVGLGKERHPNTFVQQGNYLRVMVADTGIGMDETTKRRAFEPFFTTKSCGKGTGLGLVNVYGTVKNHNGLIDFESEVNKGTRFNLYFPLITEIQEQQVEEPQPLKKHSGTILIVDDEDNIRLLVAEMLERLGYVAVGKRNGSEAVGYYREHHTEVDAIIVDLFMPGMSGNECVKTFKQVNPKALIIISSGYSLVSDTHQIISTGIAGFIQKPYEINELAHTLSQALANR